MEDLEMSASVRRHRGPCRSSGAVRGIAEKDVDIAEEDVHHVSGPKHPRGRT
jgi:hypothetical protein